MPLGFQGRRVFGRAVPNRRGAVKLDAQTIGPYVQLEDIAARMAPRVTDFRWSFTYPCGLSASGKFGISGDALRTSVGRGEWQWLPVRASLIGGVMRCHPSDDLNSDPEFIVGVTTDVTWDGAEECVRGTVAFTDSPRARQVIAVATVSAAAPTPLLGLSFVGASNSQRFGRCDPFEVLQTTNERPRNIRDNATTAAPKWARGFTPAFLDVVNFPEFDARLNAPTQE